VDATYTAFIVPLGVAFHFKAMHFSWYNAVDIAAGKCPSACAAVWLHHKKPCGRQDIYSLWVSLFDAQQVVEVQSEYCAWREKVAGLRDLSQQCISSSGFHA
jgi:hypothetical protein